MEGFLISVHFFYAKWGHTPSFRSVRAPLNTLPSPFIIFLNEIFPLFPKDMLLWKVAVLCSLQLFGISLRISGEKLHGIAFASFKVICRGILSSKIYIVSFHCIISVSFPNLSCCRRINLVGTTNDLGLAFWPLVDWRADNFVVQ